MESHHNLRSLDNTGVAELTGLRKTTKKALVNVSLATFYIEFMSVYE